ncbi:MAG: alpha-E domain-containing protein [Pseudomonas sp.]|nr:alpha-E domain-containing protein [Pseudomonas sp.]
MISMQRGGASKDAWVLGEQACAGEQWRTRHSIGVADLIRRDPYLPSRVVENLFWFGRYCERCDVGARLLRILLTRYLDDDSPLALEGAVALADGLSLLPEGASLPERLRAALLDAEWGFGLRANLQRLQGAASQVRGKLSRENWQALQELQRQARVLENAEAGFGELLETLDRLVMSLAALSGFALDDMTRDEGWRFLMIGRRLERLQALSDNLALFLSGPAVFDQAGLEALLELGNSSITYRSRYLEVAQLLPVLDLLVLDEQNPHALLFQLKLTTASLNRLHRDLGTPLEPELVSLAERLRRYDLATVQVASTVNVALAELVGLLEGISSACAHVAERLALRHFVHVDDLSQQTVSI